MLVLAADTSGKEGSLALVECEAEGDCRVQEVVLLAGGTFSAQLVPAIAALLTKHGVLKEQLDAFAVVTGPGSFTGLRVGLAATKALAEVLGKPIAGVSLLEAIAERSSQTGRVLAAVDAGRGEIFVGKYDIPPSGAAARAVGEELVLVDNFLALAQGELVVTPDRKLADLVKERGIAVELVERPRSDVIACLAWQKLRSGESLRPEQLAANYLRRSEAETLSKP